MLDLKFTQDATGSFDLSIENGNLAKVEGFDTLLQVALFTDARANSTQVSAPEHRRGWIGNLVNDIPNRQLGGLLWLLDQRRINQDTLNKAVDFAKKALNFMIEDGLVIDVNVTGIIVPLSGIQLVILITALDGTTETKYFNLWEATGV